MTHIIPINEVEKLFEVEELVDKFEMRRSHRVHVTMDVQKMFLHHFSKIACEVEYHDIPLSEIKKKSQRGGSRKGW